MSSLNSISVKPRFSRSINIERDTGAGSLQGYIPTGRALDVVRRLAQGMLDPTSGRALSITGPHGGGKSSLAIFVDSLLSSQGTQSFKVAFKLLKEFDPLLASLWIKARNQHDSEGKGFSRAVVTAANEPITESILRALERALDSNSLPESDFRKKLTALRSLSENRHRAILKLIQEISSTSAFILMIDEFGKNLESYALSPSESDPFILQAIAEMGQGANPLPIFVITMQHLSFDDYIQSSSSSQRKEWAKIQGRFQDIPFVDSPLQSRRLISSVFENKSATIKKKYSNWLTKNKPLLANAGLSELAHTEETLGSYPLHPITLAVLPQLCSRYGQNERTLFSFLASTERYSVASFLRENRKVPDSEELLFVGLDRVYDYFLESAPTMLSASSTANRWIEIESRIRDVHGVSHEEESLLKTIGVLNLVTSGGNLRASKNVLLLTNIFQSKKMKSDISLNKALENLEKRGLIVYREFADEYRVWQGSDFDLRSAIDNARRQYQTQSLATLLNRVVSLAPIVAGRASQEKGILRVFDQKFFDPDGETISPLSEASHFDGIVAYLVGPINSARIPLLNSKDRPIVYLIPRDISKLRELVIETSSMQLVLESGNSTKLDWVAKRELVERYVALRQKLLESVNEVWMENSEWFVSLTSLENLDSSRGLSSILSDICDSVFFKSPRVASEMIARRELTGQGARARKKIIEAMLVNVEESALGIEGFGPDRAIYEAVLRAPGIHSQSKEGQWVFQKPTELGWGHVWTEINKFLNSAIAKRINVFDIYKILSSPPYGLKEGVIPLITMSAILARKSEFALYEHGSLVLNLDDAVAERFVKNPSNFAIRNYVTSSKSRSLYIQEIIKNFKISNLPEDNYFLAVATALYREIHFLPGFTKSTSKNLSNTAREVREAFKDAVEPDVLFFSTLPQILGFREITSEPELDSDNVQNCARALFVSFKELRNAYPSLMTDIARIIAEATAVPSDISKMRLKLAGQANNLEGRILDKSLNAFVVAILRDSLPDVEWLENLAMVISDGFPTKTWNDDNVEKFKVKAHEIGGNMRRLQALLYDRLSEDNEGFDAARVTVTFPDGKETVRIVGISEIERTFITHEISDTLSDLESRFGSASAAKSALLAWLTSESTDSVHNLEMKKERGHG